MNRLSTNTIDCYSAGERAAMVRGQQLRAQLLRPLLERMAAAGLRPDHLTLASTLVGLAFCPLYLCGWPLAAFAALVVHVMLDGLDGPLARHLGTASRRGSLTDSMADQTVIAATTVTLMIDRQIGIAPGACYVFLYTVVVLFAMARNALGIPYRWLVRPRYLVYAWAAVAVWWWPGTLDPVLWLFNVLLAGQMLSGFVRLRRKL